MRDAMFRDRAIELLKPSDIALHKFDAGHLFLGEQGAQTMRLAIDVENPRAVPAFDQVLDNPRADKSLGAGNEKSRSDPACAGRGRWSCHAPALYLLGWKSQIGKKGYDRLRATD